MPEHNFEEEARRIMDPFRVDPSPAVWERLEASLTAKKRRRRIFYLFILAGILVGWGFYQWNQQGEAPPVAAASRQVAMPADSIEQGATGEVGKPRTTVLPENAPSSAESAVSNNSQSLVKSTEESTAGRKQSPVKSREESTAGRSQTFVKAPEQLAMRPVEKSPARKLSARVPGLKDGNSLQEKAPQVEKAVPQQETLTEAETYGNASRIPGLAAVGSPALPDMLPGIPRTVPVNGTGTIAIPDSILQHHGTMAEKHPQKNRSIQFGLQASLGRSAYTDGIGFTSKAMADQSVSQPGNMPLPTLPPYDYRQDPSLGFSAGIWMEGPMSSRWDFRVGFSYLQYATRTPVGTRVDSNRNFTGSLGTQDAQVYYQAAESGDYTNRFHLIQVPVSVAWKLNPRGSLPVSWNMGLSPGWMVSSNALVYDGSQSLYHSDANLQRFQLGLQTGLRFGFMQRSAHPLQIGPVLQYQLSRAFRDGVNGNGHLYFLGLEASMPLFHKNMKQR